MTDVDPNTLSPNHPIQSCYPAFWARNSVTTTTGSPDLSRTIVDTFRQEHDRVEGTGIKTVLLAQWAAKFFDYPQFVALTYETSTSMYQTQQIRFLQGSHGCLGGVLVPCEGIFCVFWEMSNDNIDRRYC
jgi:hypothetical protein